MVQTIDQEILHIVAHEIGHGFGLPDFYEPQDKPTEKFPPAIMMAGSAMEITDSDGWMLRRAYESIMDRYSFK
ncbi:Neutral zinc metallopeptidase [Phytophthora megakarya]|uniref:Neutral zinc metallopeptidase n=1 Tax=Phytophthora megakarya TaxID=4795 RepID=A0A225VAQ4_9STRA|nr:Neutral zinc metallopeptidase [Phytophthora megakarya]